MRRLPQPGGQLRGTRPRSSSGWKVPRSHLRLGRSRACGEATLALRMGRHGSTPDCACPIGTRREMPSADAGGLTCSHARAHLVGAVRCVSDYRRTARGLRTTANGESSRRAGPTFTRGCARGSSRLAGRSDGCARSTRTLRQNEGVPHPVERGACSRASRTKQGIGAWPPVFAARHARGQLPERQRSPGQARRRKKTPPASLGRRSKRAARREASCSRAVGVIGPADLEVKARVLFEKLGTLVLARRISPRALRQELRGRYLAARRRKVACFAP